MVTRSAQADSPSADCRRRQWTRRSPRRACKKVGISAAARRERLLALELAQSEGPADRLPSCWTSRFQGCMAETFSCGLKKAGQLEETVVIFATGPGSHLDRLVDLNSEPMTTRRRHHGKDFNSFAHDRAMSYRWTRLWQRSF